MINILKKQNKNFIKLNTILICIFLFSDTVIAKNSKRAGNSKTASKKKIRSFEGRKNSTSGTSKNTTKNTNETSISTTDIDTSHITKYNCENLYNKCMNETCFNNKTGRCSCNTTSVFETANQKCEYITNAFPYLKDEIISSYKRIAKSDCTSYTIQQNTNELNSSLSNVLAELISCMQPKCRANRTDEFVNCFDKDNMETKLKLCENIYKNVNDKTLLLEMFKDSINTYKIKYCNEIFGTMRNGECYIQIGIGTSFKDIKKTQEFKIGDTIICSENNFGIDLGKSKHEKLRLIKNVAVAGINLTSGILNIASNVVSSKQDITSNDTKIIGSANGKNIMQKQTTGQLTSANALATTLDGVSTLGTSALEALPSIMMLKEDIDTSYSGYCYAIKGEQKIELFGATDDYSYQLRWAPAWTDRGNFIGKEEF